MRAKGCKWGIVSCVGVGEAGDDDEDDDHDMDDGSNVV